MLPDQRPDGEGLVRRFVGAPVRPQTYRNLLYLGLAFPLGLAYFILVVVGVALGIGLSIILVGIPILLSVVLFGVATAGFERKLTTFLLDREFETHSTLVGESSTDRLRKFATNAGTWTPLVYLPLKFAFGLATVVVVFVTLATGVSMLFMPFYYGEPGVYVGIVTDRPVELHPALYVGWNKLLIGFETVVSLGYYRIDTLTQALVVALAGLLLCLVGLNLTNGLARLQGWLAVQLLDDSFEITVLLNQKSN